MIIVQTPLRMSFFGGGTDFPEYYLKHGGCALTTAINKYIYVIVKSRFDSNVRLTYTQAEIVSNGFDLKHDIVRECLKRVGINNGVACQTAYGTTLANYWMHNAWLTLKGGEKMSKSLGNVVNPDDMVAKYGSDAVRMYEMFMGPRKIDIGKLPENLLLFYTGITREAETVLKTQSNNTSKNLDVLNIMKEMAYQAAGMIYNGDYDGFGRSLDTYWNLKKSLAKSISNKLIDEYYEKAKKAGALGGKVLGAGGGGFLLLYCPNGSKAKVRKALSDLVEMPVSPEPDGSKVILNYRT